uniref:Uncharacterized protein n=1 Tax=Anguilla anguilla TaxID=7936 RepID=A0A0E9TGJ3_ANGAN
MTSSHVLTLKSDSLITYAYSVDKQNNVIL